MCIYESWESLNEYEHEKENYKTPKRKIEKATIGFAFGIINGFTFSLFSPFIISGVTVSLVHSYLKK